MMVMTADAMTEAPMLIPGTFALNRSVSNHICLIRKILCVYLKNYLEKKIIFVNFFFKQINFKMVNLIQSIKFH